MEPRDGHAVCPECGRLDDAVLGPLFIVTGASCSGKTAVLAPLARKLRGRCITFDADLLLDSAGALDCPDDLRRARINARPRWRSRDTEEQVEFGQWLRRNIPDRFDTSNGTPEDTAAAIIAWIDRHLIGTPTK
jgi:dephospho-CoA kinase